MTTQLKFGDHSLPIHTANEFWFSHNRLDIRALTYREGKPYGFLDYQLKIDNLKEVGTIARFLIQQNVRWDAGVEKIVPFLNQEGTKGYVDLTFSSESKRNDFYLVKLEDAIGTITHFFQTDFSVHIELEESEEAFSKMENLLKKLDGLFTKTTEFMTNDPRLQIKRRDYPQTPDLTYTYLMSLDPNKQNDGPSPQTNNLSPVFSVRKYWIEGIHRHGDLPHCKWDPYDRWESADIPYLIQSHKHAPHRAHLDGDYSPGLDGGCASIM